MADFSFIDGLVTDEELKKELNIRSKKYYEASVSTKKLPLYEEDGWYVVRKNKTTYRIRLDKKPYESLEDELWSLYARLGFSELNKEREFKVKCDDNGMRKIDIYAKDDETVIFTECTIANLPGTKKSLTGLIDKIKSYRHDVIKAVQTNYGREYKPKYGFIIATKNIAWSDIDLERARNAQITVLQDDEIEYFTRLEKNLKTAGRYQFLSQVFRGRNIPGLDIKVPATKGKMAGDTFYSFLISPDKLLKIGYVSHINSKGAEAIDTYQRMVQPKRLKEIAKYIDNGGRFPTNIVVNLEYKGKFKFEKKDEVGELSFGELTLPSKYSSAWIIDGQHRLYGYAYSKKSEDAVVPVLAYVNLDSTTQKKLFVDINNKQVKVSKNVLYELWADLHWGSDDAKEALTSLCSRVTKVLGEKKESPLYNRITSAEKKKTNFTCLTITTIANALEKEQLVGIASIIDNKSVLIHNGLGSDKGNLEQALKRATNFLIVYFNIFKNILPEQWNLGDAKGGYLCTNNAMAALLKVLKSIFDVIENRDHIDLKSQSIDDLFNAVNKYLIHLTAWIENLEEDKFKLLRSKVGAKGQIAVAREMQKVIYEQDNNFQPKGLLEWIESLDIDGSKKAKDYIDNIQLSMSNLILTKLKEEYSEGWWYDGIPSDIRTKCAARREDEKGKLELHQYLDLIDYKKIVLTSSNWSSIFQEYFTLTSESGDKNKKVTWIVKLNEMRKTVSHPERGLLNKEEANFVKELHNNVKDKFGEYWIEER